MYFYKNLYAGPGINNIRLTKWRLQHNRGQFSVYVIMLAGGSFSDKGNQLEICHCINLQQKYYRDNPPWIIGITKGISDAVEMVRALTQEAYDKTGNADMIQYLFPEGPGDTFGKRAARAYSEGKAFPNNFFEAGNPELCTAENSMTDKSDRGI